MKKRLLIGLLVMGMLAQSFTMPVMAAETAFSEEAYEINNEASENDAEETASDENKETTDDEENVLPTQTPAEEVNEETTETPDTEETASPTSTPGESTEDQEGEAVPSETPEDKEEDTEEEVPADNPEETEEEAEPTETPEKIEGETEQPDNAESQETAEETVMPSETPAIGTASPSPTVEVVSMQLSDEYVYQNGAIDVVIEKNSADEIELQKAIDWEAVYDYIYEQLKAKSTTIDMADFNIPFDEGSYLVFNVVNEHPDLYYWKSVAAWGENGIVTRYAVEYQTGYDDEAFETAVADALATIDDNMSDVEKAITLHDYLVLNCKYYSGSSYPRKVFSAYGALAEGQAVCQGYALAYKYLLEKAGITSYMVTSNSMNHAWNLVELNGKYYHVDVTWDDPLADRTGYAWHDYMFSSDTNFESNRGHSDWQVTYRNEALSLTATDTKYDTAFWTDIDSPLIIDGGYYYYIDSDDRVIRKRNTSSGIETTIYSDFEYWSPISDSSIRYAKVRSGLFMIGDRLYFNSPHYIYSIDLNGKNLRVETAKLSTSEGYVYGSACCGGEIRYALHATYNYGVTETVLTTTLLNTEGIPVNKIVLSQKEGTLSQGETLTLTATLYPSYASVKTVTWTSSNTAVATVKDGVVTAVGGGTCEITASAEGASASCKITVRHLLEKPIFSPEEGTIDAGSSVTLTAEEGTTIYYTTDGSTPAASVTKKTSAYTAPITISKDMTIKAMAVREDADNSEVAVAAYQACTNNLILNQEAITLTEGEEETLVIKELPTTKEAKDVSWKSSNTGIVTVDDSGVLKAVYEGTATVTASVKDHQGREVTAVCEVTVEPPEYVVKFWGQSSVKPISEQTVYARRSATEPETASFTVPEGYTFSGWDGNYTYILQDTDIYAKYTPVKYTITYYLNGGHVTLENPESYTILSDNITLNAPVKDGMKFAGWYTDASFTGNAVTVIEKGSTGNKSFYAKWVDERGLWMRAVGADEDNVVPNQQYTGKAIKPQIEVYYGDTLLKAGKDYSISYKNNTAANLLQTTAELKKKPTIVIKGKGNYTGTLTKTFVIEKKNLTDADVQIDNLAAAYKNGKSVKPVPTVKWNGKKLTKNKDFVVEYPDTAEGAYKQPGEYTVIVKAKTDSNYTTMDPDTGFDGVKITLTIAKPKEEILLSKVKIAAIPNQTYSEQGVTLTKDMPKLTYNGQQLTLGTDYEIKLIDGDDYKSIGTHQVMIVGKGIYKGERRVSFKITGQSVKNMNVKMPTEIYYSGSQVEPVVNPDFAFADGVYVEGTDISKAIIITAKNGVRLTAGTDFEVTFTKNLNVGTAKMTLKGKGAYTGTLTKNFKIKAYSLSEKSAGITAVFANGSTVQNYEKGGAKPKVIVKYGNTELTEGTDYTLSYANNTSLTPKTGKTPTVTIKGKGNFTGSRKLTFTLAKQDISTANITAADVIASSKAGKFYRTPVLTDANGKKLKAGTDYSKTYTYRDADGNLLSKKDKPKAGSVITVTVTGKGNYEGEISTTYRIIKKGNSLSSAKVTMKKKYYYTGEKILLSKDDLVVKVGGKTLTADQYEIVESSYKNNLKNGTAKVTLKGKGEYGGTKTIRFKIYSQKMVWWVKSES